MRALKAKSINLIPRIKDNPARDALNRRRVLFLTPVFVIVLVVAAAVALLWWNTYDLNQQAKKLTADIDGITSNLTKEAALTTQLALCKGLLSYPQFNNDLWKKIADPATARNITVLQANFDQGRGVLTLECEGPLTGSAAAGYAQALAAIKQPGQPEKSFFSSVTYGGYRESSDGTKYSFTITCVLAAKGGGAQ